MSTRYLALGLALMLTIVFGLAGCGDPNRDDCKEACTKLVTCDDPDNGGSGALNDQWLTSCQNSCDEADEIDETTASCIIETDCADIAQSCGTGAAN